MSKPTPKRVLSDDCAVPVDGTVYYPHEGEWIELYAGMSVAETLSFDKMRRMGAKLDAIKDRPDADDHIEDIVEVPYQRICAIIARHVTAWNWTDLASRPLPPPSEEALMDLSDHELGWLALAVKGETSGQRKNDSAPSPITSSEDSGEGPTESDAPSTGHNLQKRP